MKIQKVRCGNRVAAVLLCLVMLLIGVMTTGTPVRAADGTVQLNYGEKIYYGDYLTTKMTFEGNNYAYCVEPLKTLPGAGTYSYNLLPGDSPVRKALYYLPGGYGYDANIKNQYLGGWSDNDAYVIGHLTVGYVYSGYNAGSGAFHGAPANYVNKAVEVANAISGLPDPPQSFRAFIIPSGTDQTIAGSWYHKPFGYIEIRKSTANEGISGNNENYSLSGAEYGVFHGETQVAVLVTDENGYARSGELEVLENGHYTVRELKASPGFAVDVNSYDVAVQSDQTSVLEVQEIPQSNPMSILLQKLDAETGKPEAQGNASLEGAEFTVCYYPVKADHDPAADGTKPERSWVFRTDSEAKIEFTEDYLVSGDEFYYQMDGVTPCLPLGTVTIQETKAPEGYLLNDNVFIQQITAGGTVETVECYQAPDAGEQVYRADLEFVKVSDGDLERLANIPFAITSKTTGESHVIVTDENGYASTSSAWNPHTSNTNRGESSEDGIWFGEGTPDDTKGALLYDTYAIEEKRCESNRGMKLLEFEVEVYKDSVTVELGTLTNDRVVIGTQAKDADDGDQEAVADSEVTIVDTVSYENVTPGQTYKIYGVLMDKTTGEELLIQGNTVTGEAEFTPEKGEGSVDVTFTFDGTGLEGKDVVVFEKLYLVTEEEELLVTTHEDIEDEGQTIRLVEEEKPESPEMPGTPVSGAPKTGDTSDVILWIAIAVLSAAGIGGYGIVRFRKKRENEK